MLFDNLINIFSVKVVISGFFRIDHRNQSGFTTVHTNCGINSYPALIGKSECADFCFGIGTYFTGIVLPTALPASFTLVGTEKNVVVVFIVGHAGAPP